MHKHHIPAGNSRRSKYRKFLIAPADIYLTHAQTYRIVLAAQFAQLVFFGSYKHVLELMQRLIVLNLVRKGVIENKLSFFIILKSIFKEMYKQNLTYNPIKQYFKFLARHKTCKNVTA